MLGALARRIRRPGSAATLLGELADATGLELEALAYSPPRRPRPGARRATAALRAHPRHDPGDPERPASLDRAARLLGGSRGLAEFLLRNPDELAKPTTSRCDRPRRRRPRPSSSTRIRRRSDRDARRSRREGAARPISARAREDRDLGPHAPRCGGARSTLWRPAWPTWWSRASMRHCISRRTVGRVDGEPAAPGLPGRGGRGHAPGDHRHGQGRRPRAQLRQRRRRHLRRRVRRRGGRPDRVHSTSRRSR